jgi:hypothetical protein
VAVILCRLGHGVVVCLAVLKVVRAWPPHVAVVASVPAVLEVAAASDTTSPSGRHCPSVAVRPAVLEIMRVAAASATTSPSGRHRARRRRRPLGRSGGSARATAASATASPSGRHALLLSQRGPL